MTKSSRSALLASVRPEATGFSTQLQVFGEQIMSDRDKLEADLLQSYDNHNQPQQRELFIAALQMSTTIALTTLQRIESEVKS